MSRERGLERVKMRTRGTHDRIIIRGRLRGVKNFFTAVYDREL